MATENPRPEKVAIVEEIKGHLDASDAIVLTEYRGLDVPQQAELRAAVRKAGGEVKIYKNTLARLAANDLGLEVDELLMGPTALAFTPSNAEDVPANPAALTKALQDFADNNPAFVIKGGLLDGMPVDAETVKALSKLAPRDAMLSRFAQVLQAWLVKAELHELRILGDPRIGPTMRAAVLDLLADDEWGDWVDSIAGTELAEPYK